MALVSGTLLRPEARAEETGANAFELPPVVVIAGPGATAFESPDDATGHVHVVDTREAWRGYETVAEVLDRSVGVQVRRLGGRQGFAAATVRGSTPAQVKILLDGVSLTRASDAVVNLADLPMDAVERIEIYRGFTPVRFASSGAASVINIVTRKEEAAASRAAVTYGSFDTAKLSLHGSRPFAGASTSAFFTAQKTNGDFELLDNNGTELNPNDDFVRDRENNDHLSYDLLLRYVRELAGGSELTVSNQIFYKDEGAPGVAFSEESETARFRSTRNLLTGHWRSRSGSVSLTGGLTYLEETLLDPKTGLVGDMNDLGFGFVEADNTTVAATLEGRWSRPVGDVHLLETSAEAAHETFRGRFPQNPGIDGGDEDRTRLSVAVGDEIYCDSLDLTLAPQLRAEGIWNNFDGDIAFFPIDDLPSSSETSIDPRLGLRWDPHSDVTVRANAGTYFRPPTFGELFGDQGSAAANPELEAESGTSYDAGFLLRGRVPGLVEAASFEYVYFYNDAEDLILLITTGASVPKSFNFAAARTSGHELRLEATGPGAFGVEANFTFQDTKNLSNITNIRGNELPNLPAEEGFLRLAWGKGRWNAEYTLEYRSDAFLDAANNPLRRVSAYTLHGVSVSLGLITDKLELKLEAENLSDERVLDQWAFPRPGRSFFVTLSYEENDR